MKLQPEQTLKKLGFGQVTQALASRARTEGGRRYCEELVPTSNKIELHDAHTRLGEYLKVLDTDEAFYPDYSGDVTPYLRKASIEGNWLLREDVFALLKWLRMVRDAVAWFRTRRDRFPTVWQMFNGLEFDKAILADFETVINDRGKIKDSASDDLRRIRREMNRISSELRKQLNSILKNAIKEGWTLDKEVTIRNDRLVIPLRADFKGRVKGFVHDVSQSGQTIFVEPQESLESNNRIRRLFGEEKNEIVRILTDLTEKVREKLPELRGFAELMDRVDFLGAKARLAQDWKCSLPKVHLDQKVWKLVLAYHPLLVQKLGKLYVIPLNMEINSSKRIVLISGPNAGGKSVSLKTVGLLQVMLQSGLAIPVDPTSEFSLVNKIFIDIGDEQSIQSDLSTYTSHLAHMREMLDGLDDNSLFLIDEFGSGTDPRLGGAIAEAFLERFVKTKALGIITTHYGNLKTFADTHAGIQNAAMEFDPADLAPTYRIQVGMPGRSYAFEIARNVGVPDTILKAAEKKISKREIYTDELLLKLENQKAELERITKENKAKQGQLKFLQEQYETLKGNLEVRQADILRKAEEEAESLVKGANARIERTIREIKESQADKEKTKRLRKDLETSIQRNTPEKTAIPDQPAISIPELENEKVAAKTAPKESKTGAEKRTKPKPIKKTPLKTGPLEVGDWVLLKANNSKGEIMEIKKKKAVVAVGGMRMTLKVADLERTHPPIGVKSGPSASTAARIRIQEIAQVKTELNVMGKKVDETLPLVTKFVDAALAAGLREVRILHGKGTGALRTSIRQFLRSYPEIVSMEDAPIQLGGAGWTVVRFVE